MDPLKLASAIPSIVNFFYPHVAKLICKVLPDDNSLSLKIESFLTSETAKILENTTGMAAGEYVNAQAQLNLGLNLLNGMVPENGATIFQMHQMFLSDQSKTELRRTIIQSHLASALESSNKCFAMGQQSGQNALRIEQILDTFVIRIFCTTLQTLEAFAPEINFCVIVNSWIQSIQFLYNNPTVKTNINKNVKRKRFRNKKLFEQIKTLLLALNTMAEEMSPQGAEKDLIRLKIELHESQYLKHHRFLADDVLRMMLHENEEPRQPVAIPERRLRVSRNRTILNYPAYEIEPTAAGVGTSVHHKDYSAEDFNFPPLSIILVGGVLSDGSTALLESYCTKDSDQSTLLDLSPQFPRYNQIGCKIGSKIIISGGRDADENPLKSTEFFDVMTKEWSFGPDMNPRLDAVSACIGDTLFVFGGEMSQKNTMTAERFQMPSFTWQSMKDLPALFKPGGAVAVCGKIFLMGYEIQLDQDQSKCPYTLIYDPLIDQYTPSKRMRDFRWWFGSTFVDDNTIVVSGGNDGDRTLNSVEIFDIRTEEWISMKSMNNARECHQLVNVDGVVYALGGYDCNEDEYPFSVEMFDVRCNSWLDKAPLMDSRINFTAFVV